jgi:serine/threonine protein kinase
VLGRLEAHPDGTDGLVMALIDPGFRPLAGPPSLATCTRDVYPEDARFTADVALRVARVIASAAAHLHARGILHGDLYAHNILHDGAGRVFLGDFGAASFVSPADPVRARRLEQVEVRACGCLLEELAERTAPGVLRDGLAALAARCLGSVPALRPGFDEIVHHLDGLAAG